MDDREARGGGAGDVSCGRGREWADVADWLVGFARGMPAGEELVGGRYAGREYGRECFGDATAGCKLSQRGDAGVGRDRAKPRGAGTGPYGDGADAPAGTCDDGAAAFERDGSEGVD